MLQGLHTYFGTSFESMIYFMLSYLYAFHFVPSEQKEMKDEEIAVVVIIGGVGGIAVVIGLYKLDALGKLSKYLDSRI